LSYTLRSGPVSFEPDPDAHPVADARQVLALVHWARQLDSDGRLAAEFSPPPASRINRSQTASPRRAGRSVPHICDRAPLLHAIRPSKDQNRVRAHEVWSLRVA
jgi:hypothetical protein